MNKGLSNKLFTRVCWAGLSYFHSAEDFHLCKWTDGCVLFPVQRLFKRLLTEDKAAGGCHKF